MMGKRLVTTTVALFCAVSMGCFLPGIGKAPDKFGPAVKQEGPGGTPPGVPVPQPAMPDVQNNKSLAVPAVKNGGKIKFALTLAGGGARGAAHIGVLKVLEAEGLRPDFVSGSSIGSMVGALYCAGMPVADIEKLFLNGKLKKAFFPTPVPLQVIGYVPKYALKSVLRIKQQPGLYTGKKVARFVNKSVPPTVTRMEDMKIPFAAIATNVLDTRPFWITEGNIGEAVRASCTVPYFYQPVKLEGRMLLDGGIRSNLPTDPARAVGADVVVAVKLHSDLEAKSAQELNGIMPYSERIFSMLMAEIESKNMSEADVLIEPDIKDVKYYSFDPKTMGMLVGAGEEAARKMVPQIREALRKSEGTAAKDAPVEEQL